MQWKWLKAECLIEGRSFLVLGIDNDGIDAEAATRIDYPPDCISHQEFAKVLAAYPQIPREATDEGGRNHAVLWEFASELLWKFVCFDRVGT